MDFSKQYIKMCERAKEVQKKWKLQLGDYFFRKDREGIGLITNISLDGIISVTYLKIIYDKELELCNISGIAGNIDYVKETKIWLPRQDQLQAIITTNKYFRFGLIELFYHFANKNISKFTSMEKLWLAFVMYVKYNKIWDNKKEKWIKEKK